MSIWTHVAGIIRINFISEIDTPIDLNSILGTVCTGDNMCSTIEEEEKCTTPCGSEGSLQHEVVDGKVIIWGDLRDYEDLWEIQSWFTSIVNSELSIRDAILLARVEGGEERIFYLNDNKELKINQN